MISLERKLLDEYCAPAGVVICQSKKMMRQLLRKAIKKLTHQLSHQVSPAQALS